MKLSDSGQTDCVLAHEAGWTLDDEDETSKLVCEFWIWKSFISKKIQDIRGVSKDTKVFLENCIHEIQQDIKYPK